MSSPKVIKALLISIISSAIFEFRFTFQISTSVQPEAIPVETNRILHAITPKDHSNALVLLDTKVTTMEKLVKVNIVRVRTSFIRLAYFFA